MQQKSYWDPNGLFDNITFDQILDRSFEETDELSNWFNDFNHADNGYKPENLKAGTIQGLKGILMEHGHNMDTPVDGKVVMNWEQIHQYITSK